MTKYKKKENPVSTAVVNNESCLYEIAQSDSVIDLKVYVHKFIDNGFTPVGAPFCHREFWYQALIKK